MLEKWWQIASVALVSGFVTGFVIDRLLTRQPRRIWFKGTFEFENHRTSGFQLGESSHR
jgi:uncharacterized membrane-anchored protein YhcB (DUF1043 family)